MKFIFIKRVIGRLKRDIWGVKQKIIIRIAMKVAPIAGYVKIENKIIKNLYDQEQVYKRFQEEYSDIRLPELESDNGDWKPYTIWTCWWQGYDNAPRLVQKCISSIEKNLCQENSKYHLVVIDKDNYKSYCNIDDEILAKWKAGIISNAHMADLLRIELLNCYGGIWVDATVLCTASKMPEYIQQSALFVYQRIELDRSDEISLKASNWFIVANQRSKIIALTREYLFQYWKKENSLLDYYIFHIFFRMAIEKYPEEWKRIPVYNNISPHILQFELQEKYSEKRFEQIKEMSDFHKLNHHEEKKELGFYTNYDYILEN